MLSSKSQIIKSTIRCVGKCGLENIRTQMIAEQSNVSEAMIFKLFGNKNELLQKCFETVDKQISEIFLNFKIDEKQIKTNPEALIYFLWNEYFNWLIENKEEMLFYFAYVSSPFFQEYQKSYKSNWFDDFAEKLYQYFDEKRLQKHLPTKLLWTQLVMVTQIHAKPVIEGELSTDISTKESLFKMQMGSVCEIFKANIT